MRVLALDPQSVRAAIIARIENPYFIGVIARSHKRARSPLRDKNSRRSAAFVRCKSKRCVAFAPIKIIFHRAP
ncbi:MAG: hypothetical protein FJX62_16060 [Alphaproteobacteria bacterium]|nr:hypothetical protein [Alphaproteobacteria bacterium]